jgi:hypothetical protein
MIRKEIEELYPIIQPNWTDEGIVEWIEGILPFVPDEDLDENLELIARMKAYIRNKKIKKIFKKD